MRKNILAILGSTKQNSSNKGILNTIAKMYEDHITLTVFEDITKLPHFNPDLDNEAQLPNEVQELRTHILSADGIIICTPEYVFSLPGSLKNAIEWNVSTTLFSNKPTALIVAAASGEKAFESLDLVMSTLEAKMEAQTKLLIQGVKSKISIDGYVSDQKTIEKMNTLMKALLTMLDV